MATHFSGPIVSTNGFQGPLTGDVTGAQVLNTPTAYAGATGSKAIDPSLVWATLTKGSAGTDYTLAAPGAANVGRTLRVTSTGAYAHVVTVTGLVGGTTMTLANAAGNGFEVFAATASLWVIRSNNGCTQT